ncbi:TNF receptor-associated factor 4-like isoform X2 [Varroa destructor]|uniref:TNF receptor-associated factor 4 n=2 Tax=Varroa TaxID=62624 RepID=A0A7M7KPC1_VARDE|nr:TNF receptor-associated factor 4-like isoform X2 [Varroa destructor]
MGIFVTMTGISRICESHVIDGESCCPYEPVYCESKCGMRIPRKLASEHLRAECVNRLTACPFCGYDFVFDTLKKHIPACPRFVADHVHKQQQQQQQQQQLQHVEAVPVTHITSKTTRDLHLNNNNHTNGKLPLLNPMLPCVFKDIGCKFKGSAPALDQHLESSSRSHLALTCQIVSRQQAQISALRSALHNVTLNTTGTMLWKVTDFYAKLGDARAKEGYEVCSPPFMTSAHGYKLQASLFLNGNGSGEGSHLSVYIKILPGEFDSLLRWPFSLTVSFTLIDQPLNPDKACHIIESFVPDPTWKNFQRPSKEPDALGFGFPRFVSHEMLKKCHYLRDGTLFIRVKVDESKIIAV